MPENGNYVTRAELNATVTPMRDDISEIKTDVKALLAQQAGKKAVSGLLGRTATAVVTLGSGAVGALIALAIH